MENKNYRYILEKHTPGSRSKYECPNCGKARCFTRFIDSRTGQYVADEVGICDHLNSCGYRLSPYDYFAQHPELDRSAYNGNGTMAKNPYSLKPKIRSMLHLDIALVLQFKSRESAFVRFLQKISPSDAELERVCNDYLLGATGDGGVIYWQIDRRGFPHEGKIMYYNEDGHRSQNRNPNFIGTKYSGQMGIPQNYPEGRSWCLFGEHLLHTNPDRQVMLVESEKTAVICSLFYPEYVWLATSGCSMLNEEVVRVLEDRRVVVFPDSGCYDKWKAILAKSCLKNYSVNSQLESYPGNTDLADILLKELLPT